MSTYLFGDGGLGKEVLSWILTEEVNNRPDVGGFVVDDSYWKPDVSFWGYNTFKFSDVIKKDPQAKIIVCIGNSQIRRKVFHLIKQSGCLIAGFQSSKALISMDCKIGEGVIVNPGCRISPSVEIGDGTLLNCNSGVGHDCKIGAFSTFFGNAVINGDVTIGDDVTVGAGVIIHPGLNIGEKSVIGIGSVVIRNVLPETTVFGNPAKKI